MYVLLAGAAEVPPDPPSIPKVCRCTPFLFAMVNRFLVRSMTLIDHTFCPDSCGFQCWVKNTTSCDARGDVLTIRGVPEVAGFTRKAVPEVFRKMLLQCSPIKRRFWFYWWRAQSVTYLVRFNARTRKAVDKMRSESLFACDTKVTSSETLAQGTISVHVRHGRKATEADVFEFSKYLEEMEPLAADSTALRVLYPEVAESNTTFSYPANTYTARKIFLSTEDQQVVDEALRLCEGKPRWEVMYTRVRRSNDDAWVHAKNSEDARYEVLTAFMNLELALEADAWVCTLSSNWCRLIDELRMTIGRKASHPYLSLSLADFQQGMKDLVPLTACMTPRIRVVISLFVANPKPQAPINCKYNTCSFLRSI